MATIKAIQASSIHQIQSGQVIVDLCSVVKELVENSLDAGASSIDVRFKNNGLDSIEVQDNGNGIATEDYETIALKHYTSKLSSYEDLDRLDTFGFRGEALSSLCALSDFHITTAVAGSGPKGSRLDFEISGKLKNTSVVAAQKGTTVSVERLFKNLPVRRRELEKNIKREYSKVLNLLQAYACISINVRFAVSHQPSKGSKTSVFSTKSNPTTKENIVNVYGAKTLLALTKLDLAFELQPSTVLSAQSIKPKDDQPHDASRQVLIQGHISRPVFGEGRQAPDRQMFFVNSRPCALPQVSKAFNEVYKSFNMSQSPFIFANLIMDTNAYDVNVSPDKRTILLHDQSALLDSLKDSLTRMFDHEDQTVPASRLQAKKLPGFKQPTLLRTETSDGSFSGFAHSQRQSRDASEVEEDVTAAPQVEQTPGRLIQQWVGRDAESRQVTQAGNAADGMSGGHTIPADKLKLLDALAGQKLSGPSSRVARAADEVDIGTFDPLRRSDKAKSSAASGLEFDLADVDMDADVVVPQAVKDFNARMQSQAAKKAGTSRITTETVELSESGSEALRSRSGSVSDEIASTQPARTKFTGGPVQNAFDHMRPKRKSEDIATITVGDQTTRMVLGTPEAKRVRTYTPGKSLKKTNGSASLGFSSSLRQFAAPGTQLAGLDSAPEDKDKDQAADGDAADVEDGDESLPADSEADEDMEESASAPPYQSPGAGLFVEADDSDDEYLDEDDKKAREDARVAQLIQEAEEAAAQPSDKILKRASQAMKSSFNRKDSTLRLEQTLQLTDEDLACGDSGMLNSDRTPTGQRSMHTTDDIADANAEKKLSLTVSKANFGNMRIIGQFNLGFILAVRQSTGSDEEATEPNEEHLFIIDQHAADEKFNFERLSATTTLVPQRLVTPKELQLSAVEEELILANQQSLVANGFEIEAEDPDVTLADLDGADARRAFRLLTLPTSKETTFSTSDLEELLHLLSETSYPASTIPPDAPLSMANLPPTDASRHSTASTARSGTSTAGTLPSKTIVRPSRVRKMLAMRACRSSIMVGKNLTKAQMGKVVRHMGEMERPWNCPHGRPTMRHLAGLWEWRSWQEDLVTETDWEAFTADEV